MRTREAQASECTIFWTSKDHGLVQRLTPYTTRWSKEGGWCEGSSSNSARWWSTSRRLGPAIMPASAPRPLALAGVTRNKQISFYRISRYRSLTLCRQRFDKDFRDRSKWCDSNTRHRVDYCLSWSIWIHHRTGTSMHLVFQGFPDYLFHWLP